MLTITAALHRRPRLTRLFLEYHAVLTRGSGIRLLAAVSDYEASAAAAERGWQTIWVKNSPLSNKHNALSAAVEPDSAMLLLGSDDFLSEIALQHYCDLLKTPEIQFAGTTSQFFYDLRSKKAARFRGYQHPRKDEPPGPGRYFAAPLLQRLRGSLWSPGKSRGLDQDSYLKLCSVTRPPERDALPAPILSVKGSGVNMWKFSEMSRHCAPETPERLATTHPDLFPHLTEDLCEPSISLPQASC